MMMVCDKGGGGHCDGDVNEELWGDCGDDIVIRMTGESTRVSIMNVHCTNL